ncbi:MAG: hypothetical protein ACD_47C00212G0001 [uncultured bacterium]|nr:MAG: hypothetical protein ACD_47C00212G0001 [uncultured bacterium]
MVFPSMTMSCHTTISVVPDPTTLWGFPPLFHSPAFAKSGVPSPLSGIARSHISTLLFVSAVWVHLILPSGV